MEKIPNIIIVENEPSWQRTIMRCNLFEQLKKLDPSSLVLVATEKEAHSKLRDYKFDLAITDVMLEDDYNESPWRILANSLNEKGVPIIVVTGFIKNIDMVMDMINDYNIIGLYSKGKFDIKKFNNHICNVLKIKHNQYSNCNKVSTLSKKIFVSYSHKDKVCKEQLVNHLSVLRQNALIDIWDDSRIPIGEHWHSEITDALTTANIAIFLISTDFLNSKFILEIEIPTLLEKCSNEGLKIIPIIIKPCAWKTVNWLSSMRAVTLKNNEPLMKGTEYEIDEKFAEITQWISEMIQ